MGKRIMVVLLLMSTFPIVGIYLILKRIEKGYEKREERKTRKEIAKNTLIVYRSID